MSGTVRPVAEMHSYTLWCDVVKQENGSFAVDTQVMTIGKDGIIKSSRVYSPAENNGMTDEQRFDNLLHCNIAEMERAIKEGGKWEQRLRDAPLGKTQQDFVAYYTDVIYIFRAWHTLHRADVPVPPGI